MEFREKTISGVLSEILCKPGYPLPKLVKICPTFCNFIFALKKFTQVLSYVVFTQVRGQVYRQITKRRYGEKNPGRFVFGKSTSFTIGLGLITPYSLSILV